MRVTEKMKKLLSILLCLCMLVQNCPVVAFASGEDNLCEHHTEHTAECGYREGSAGSACAHEHSEDCYAIVVCIHEHDESCGTDGADCTHECTVENGCITMELDCHHVHGGCGYSEGTAEVPCGHVHNESCGYVEAVAGNPCANAETDPECDHSGDCGFVATVEGQPCGHTACDDTCGYAPATEGTPCTHVCEVKVDSDDSCYKILCSHKDGGHDDACGYAEAVEAHECHYECAECAAVAASEEAPEESPDPAPVCTCAEACTTENFNEYCAVCGVDYSKCTGTDTAVAYAEGDKVSVTINGETTYYTSIKDAVAKANESGNATITLLQDTTTGERLDITNSATLDLNGNTLSCTAYFADDYETMVAITTNNTKLTIIDSVGGGKLDGTGTDYALMLGEPGAYTARSASAYIDGSTVSGSVKTVSGTSMTVSGSTVESNSVVATIDMTNETTLNVFNSQILNTHSSSAASAIDNSGTLTITDSTVSGSIGVVNGGTANISGNTNITSTVCSVKSWVESQDSTLTITGGSYTGGIDISGGTATISGGSYTGGIVVSGGTATISDGTITESRSNKENAVEVSGSADLTISGGTFSAIAGETYDTGVYVHDGGTVKIIGGTITGRAYGVYNDGGSATITGGTISGGTVDLQVVGSDSILNLTLDEGKTVGATFPGGITVEGNTLTELLATDTAAYWGVVDGKDTMLTVADDAATGITDKGDITIRAICDHKDVKLDYITTDETTHTPVCSVCNWTGEATEHTGGTATCQAPAVCEACGVSYGDLDANIHTPTEDTIFTVNDNGTHSYTCACGAAVAEVPHTLDVTTGKCVCGADMTVVATVTDGTNTYYAADAATLNQAVTAILETGSRTFTVELPANAEAGMITAIRRAICDTEGVADGSIHLTLKGVTTIPGTTNWDGVAFGPRNAQWDENNVEIVSHEEVAQLASVNLPDVTEIGAQAFYFCENLVAVSAPKAQTIGAQALGYTALTSVEFPELTSIPTDMFSGTWTLSSAKFPKVTTIEQGGLLVGAKFAPENNPTPFPLELTAEGNITFNGSNHFNIASQNYSGKVDLVLCCDKADKVTKNEDGTATWQVRDDLSYTFKSITFKHSYVDGKCTACGEDCAHTGGTATCTTLAVCDTCGVSYGAVDTNNHDSSVECENGFCPNGCYEPATLNAAGYYEIDNAGKLFWFAQQVNVKGNREIKGVLTAHIDLENKPWTPIGETGENNNFRGVFDGQGRTIRGLNVEGSENGVGFFGEVRTGTVKNFTIYGNVVVNTEVDYVGGVIGSICGLNSTDHGLERNGAIIQNITSFVNVTAKAHGIGMIGGFVGYANHQSLIEQCAWYGTFDAGEYRVDSGAGGFIGKIQENTSEVTIRNCGAYGTIKTNYAGDYNNTPTIYMGGFLSFSNTDAKTTLENCLFAGRLERGENLTDQAFLGAFGTLRSVNAIKNCYYLGDDGLTAVHSDSNLKPGSDNVEITSVTGEELRSNTIATQLGDHWMQDVHYPIPKDTKAHSDSATYTYTDNGDGTHKATCTECGYEETSRPHTIENHACTDCGAMEIVVSFDAGDFEWKTGDKLSFCRVSGDNEWEEYAFTATVAGDGTVTWTPDKTLYWDGTGEHKLVVIYPDTGYVWDTWYIDEDQSTLENLRKNDHLNAIWSGNPTTDTITFNLKHRMAKVTVNYEAAEGVTVSKAEVYTLTQYLLFDIHTLERKNVAWEEGHDLWINSYHNGNQFTAFVSPDAYAAGGNFIKITLDNGTVYEVKMSKAVTFAEGSEYTYKVVITADEAYIICADECTFEYTDNGDGTHTATCSKCGYAVTEEHTLLTYSASGNVITGSCSKCPAVGTATITAENTTYKGTAQETATVAYSEGWNSGELTVSYVNNVNAGTATASITVGEATASVEFTIAKAEIDGETLINPEFAEGLIYNGTAQALVTKTGSVDGGYIVYSLSIDGEYTTTIPVATEAGNYRVYWTIECDENHYVDGTPGSRRVTIAKANPEYTVPTGLTATYGDTLAKVELPTGWAWKDAETTSVGNAGTGTFKALYNPDSNNYNTVEADVTVEVAKANPEYTVPTGLTATYGNTLADVELPTGWAWNDAESTSVGNAGTRTFKALYNPDSNNYNTVEADVTIEVAKALIDIYTDNLINPEFAENLVYNGTAQALVTNSGSIDGGYIVFSLNPDGEYTTEIPVATEAGEYVVFYRIEGDENHYWEGSSAFEAVTIAKANPEYTVPTGLTATYGDTLAKVELPTGWAWKDAETTSVGNAGKRTFKALYNPDSNNYNTVEADVTVEVAKADPEYTVPTGLTATYSDTLADVELPAGWTWKDAETTSVGNAGTRTFKAVFTPADTVNYNTVEADVTIEVAKVEIDGSTLINPEFAKGLIYNGTAQALVTKTGSVDGGYIVYSLSIDGEYTTTIPVATEAGNYGVYWTIECDENHYIDGTPGSSRVTIAAKAITVTADAVSKTYGDTDPTLTYKVEGLVNGDELTGELKRVVGENVGSYAIEQNTLTAGNNYSITYTGANLTINAKAITEADVELNGSLTYTGEEQTQPITVTEGITYEISGNKGTAVGAYELTVKGTGNYTGEVKLKWSIKEALAVVGTAPTAKSLTYTGEAQVLVNAGTTADGKLVYSLTENGEYTENIPSGINAGDYTVWYYVVGDDNHADSAKVSVKVTIAKAKATITVDTTTINVTYGESVTLPTATTNFGTVTCNKAAADLVNAGTYIVTYTVEGTDNYDGDTKTLTVIVNQKEVAEPTITGTYTYTGNEQTVNLTGVESYMTVVSGNKGTDAGSYEVVITLDGNHKWADGSDGKVQWSIAKAQAEINVNTDPITVTYGETVTLPTATTNFGAAVCDKTAADLVNAGTYTVTYTVAGTDNYDGDTKSITVTVNAKAITVTADAVSKTYGDTDPTLTYTAQGLVNGDELTGELKRVAGENVGSYAIEQNTLTAGNNYSITYTGANLTINAKAITEADVELNGSLTYTGKEQTQPITVTEGITYEVTGNKATNVGSYVLTVKGTGNYTGEVKLNWSIKETAAVVTKAPAAKTLTYTGTAQNLVNAGSANGGTMVYSLSENGQYTETIPTGANAGEYTVWYYVQGDANHSDTAKASIKVMIHRASATFEITNNVVLEGTEIKLTVTSEPANVSHEVSYRQDGKSVTVPAAVGEYDVYVTITDSNYRHATSTDGSALKVGVLSIYKEETPETYTLSYAAGGATGTMAAEQAALAGTVRILPESTFTAPKDENDNAMLFAGWSDGTAVYQPGEKYVQPEQNVTMTAVWQVEEHNISGMVKQYVSLDSTERVNREGVTITLMLGSRQITQTVTDENGNYQFEHCLQGTYNLIAEYEGIKQTIKVVLGHSDQTGQEIDLPAAKTNTAVAVQPGTPAVVVGGMDDIMTKTDDTVFTEEDKDTVEAGGEVEIKMDIKENPAPANKAEIDQKVEDSLNTSATVELYIDLDLTKTVRDANGTEQSSTAITESNVLLENIIFLPGHLQGKDAYHVFRQHGNDVEEMKELPAGTEVKEEGFVVDRTNHTITIYSRKYSTFAIVTSEVFTITFDANGGTVGTSTMETEEKLNTLPTPERSGFKFIGWFTEKTGGTEVDTSTVFTQDTTVYAQWERIGYQIEFPTTDTTGTIKAGGVVEIDGKLVTIDNNGEIWMPATGSKLLVSYKFNENADPHKEYPTAMYAWFLKWEGDTCEAIRIPELDNFMTYKGTSIRVNHSSDGIRFFTAVPVDALNKVMKGTLLTGELEGYKLVEMGTLYKWAETGTELTIANGAKSYVYGGSAGSTYRQFSKEGSLSWFTGMLTDLPGDAATLAKDILSRPYAVFENADGDQITLYGGSIQRSIYYVALQNKDTWASGTAYDNYVEKIISAVEAAKG